MRGKGEASVYKRSSDNRWVGAITLPDGPNGQRRRKVLTHKDKSELLAVMDDFKTELRKSGDLPTKGQTLETWLGYWLRETVAKKNNPKTIVFYRSIVKQHIVPSIGKIRLDKLTPATVRKMTGDVFTKGLSSTTAGHAQRTLSIALKAAMKDGRVQRNVAELTDRPAPAAKGLSSLTAEQGIQVLLTAAGRVPLAVDPYASLWAAVLLTGARQGELLGLELDRITDVLDLSWQLQRLSWEHGCSPACGRKRAAECPAKHVTHPPNWESRHIIGGLWWSRPKSSAGWRIIPLVEPLKTIMGRQMDVANSRPNPHGLLWTKEDGSPLDPRAESEAWDALLKRAKVPDIRLHDGRHTTVDLLYAASVPEDLIMAIVGHSVVSTTRGYRTRTAQPRLVEAMESLSKMLEA